MAKNENIFSKNLKVLLAEREITQRGLAELAGVATSTVNDWLNGVSPTDPSSVLKLSQALKCDFQWLLTGIKSKANKVHSLAEVFDIEDDPSFSGIFMIEAKRLKKRRN